jgi:hypothetical protein
VNELANSAVFWVLAFTVLGLLFLLPTLIGLARGVDALPLVFLVNLIGAPILIGWPAALILAFGPRRQHAVRAAPTDAGARSVYCAYQQRPR